MRSAMKTLGDEWLTQRTGIVEVIVSLTLRLPLHADLEETGGETRDSLVTRRWHQRLLAANVLLQKANKTSRRTVITGIIIIIILFKVIPQSHVLVVTGMNSLTRKTLETNIKWPTLPHTWKFTLGVVLTPKVIGRSCFSRSWRRLMIVTLNSIYAV